jgi:hypothetical protein
MRGKKIWQERVVRVMREKLKWLPLYLFLILMLGGCATPTPPCPIGSEISLKELRDALPTPRHPVPSESYLESVSRNIRHWEERLRAIESTSFSEDRGQRTEDSRYPGAKRPLTDCPLSSVLCLPE